MTNTPGYLGDDLRARIYDAALKLFASEGHHAVAVPRIAEVAQVGVGSIYRVAESKRALADDLYTYWLTRFNNFVLNPFELTGENYENEFFLHWKRVTDWVLEHPLQMRFLILQKVTYTVEPPPATPVLTELREALGKWVTAGVLAGQVRPILPETFAAIIRGPIVFLVLENLQSAETLEDAGRVIWRGIKA